MASLATLCRQNGRVAQSCLPQKGKGPGTNTPYPLGCTFPSNCKMEVLLDTSDPVCEKCPHLLVYSPVTVFTEGTIALHLLSPQFYSTQAGLAHNPAWIVTSSFPLPLSKLFLVLQCNSTYRLTDKYPGAKIREILN